MNTFSSILSLDMGGKHTGFFSFTNQKIEKIDNFQSGTISYDQSLTLSQVNRRAKRHAKRNKLRNKFAKRLFELILKEYYHCKFEYLPDEVRGLFNRRGYTYANFEIDEKTKEILENDEFRDFLEENEIIIDFKITTQEYIESITSEYENLIKFDEKIKKLHSEHIKQKGLGEIIKFIEPYLKESEGNLSRKRYFEVIIEQIDKEQKIQDFIIACNVPLDNFKCLIANISNFQLKQLRRYFNSEDMKNADIWDEQRLHKIIKRFVKSWHCKSEKEKITQKELLQSLKKQTAIEFLTTVKPINTIPPYDDMNNRGAVKCQSLRLNIDYLNKHLPSWRMITNALANEAVRENLKDSTYEDEDTTLLHRIIDTSSSIDAYSLRKDNISGYVDLLGEKLATSFKDFLYKYYNLINTKVRTGIWSEEDDMLKVCGKNTPYKNNQLHNLVASILGVELTKERFDEFLKDCWNKKEGNSKLSSYCKNIEELRKKHGNGFKMICESSDDKNIKNLQIKQDFWVDKIGTFFDIEEKYRARFNNLFSLAQLYTIIDTKTSGFSSTCKWCSCENAYRSKTKIDIDEQTKEVITNANCQRLPANTQRPFSGKIERYIDRLGYELAQIKAKELQSLPDGSHVELNIVLEQNNFEYEESIRDAKIKSAKKKANDNLKNAKKKYDENLLAKIDRIKAFNDGICLYCDGVIGEHGEIDHILPRSFTLKKYGTVFNGEGNLLYIHSKCNQEKGNEIYSLKNIKCTKSKEWIEKTIESIKVYKNFRVLNTEQQEAFRYALFLENPNDAKNKVESFLRSEQSNRVNGTQKYLAKKIQEKLKKLLEDKVFKLDFDFKLVDSSVISQIREAYAKNEPLLKKPGEKQPASSHTIDAIVTLIAQNPDFNPSVEDMLKFAKVNTWVAQNDEIHMSGKSTNSKIGDILELKSNFKQVFSRSIFGENALGENYRPIIKHNKKYYCGYPISKKGSYDLKYCKELGSQSNIKMIETIIGQNLFSVKQKVNIVIYETNKQKVNDLANKYFNYNYNGLSDEEKDLAKSVEFIFSTLKYFTKKTKVLCAPNYINKHDYPFYEEWRKFDNAWKFAHVNKNMPSSNKEFFVISKEQNTMYIVDKKKGEYIIKNEDIGIWNSFCHWYFIDRYANNTNKTIRTKTRKVFSLKTIGTPQGTVFRVKRNTPKGSVYQTLILDNNEIAGDYSQILLKANSKTLSIAKGDVTKELNALGKEIVYKKEINIRDMQISPSQIFTGNLDISHISVVLNRTSLKIVNYPLDYFKQNLLTGIDKIETTTLYYGDVGINKNALNSILKHKPRSDQSIKNIVVDGENNAIGFTLAYRNTLAILNN